MRHGVGHLLIPVLTFQLCWIRIHVCIQDRVVASRGRRGPKTGSARPTLPTPPAQVGNGKALQIILQTNRYFARYRVGSQPLFGVRGWASRGRELGNAFRRKTLETFFKGLNICGSMANVRAAEFQKPGPPDPPSQLFPPKEGSSDTLQIM